MSPVKEALSPSDIKSRLLRLPGWSFENNAILKTLSFPTYLAGLEYVERLGRDANQRDHHPSIILDYKKVTVTFSTHSAKGVTELDFEGAEQAERLFSESR